MTREKMINYVAANIRDYLPAEYRDAEVNIVDVTKLNKSYTGLSVRKQNACLVPTINLDAVLVDVEDENGLKMAMKEMGKHILEDKSPEFSLDILKDYSLARENLFIKACGAEMNKEALSMIPHIIIEDLAITFHVMLKRDSDQVTSATIQYNMLPLWGINQDTLVSDAVENSMRSMPVKICPLSEVLGLMGAMMPGESPLVLVSNEHASYGAAALFYPGVYEKVAEFVKGSYYVLPSSCHEVLVLPADQCEASVKSMKEMVTEINATQVEPEERLSDSVYFYDASTKQFSKLA